MNSFLFRYALLLTASAALLPATIIYEADFFDATIYALNSNGTRTTLARDLNTPYGMAFSATGDLYFAQVGGGITKVNTTTGVQTSFVSQTVLNAPFGLAFDASGNLFEADKGSGNIFKFTAAGVKSTFATGLNNPFGLAFDSLGNLYETDNGVGAGTGSIYKFAPGGAKTTFATGLSHPAGIAVDAQGNLFVTDNTGSNLYKYTPGGVQSVFASGLNDPYGLNFDAAGNLYVASWGDHAVYEYAPNGTRSLFASNLGPWNVAIAGASVFNVSPTTPEPASWVLLFSGVTTGGWSGSVGLNPVVVRKTDPLGFVAKIFDGHSVVALGRFHGYVTGDYVH